jgi:VIT1/CCC1 family predicted Fe2+/Mn2+ transporter
MEDIEKKPARARVLDPVDRVSEVIYGLLMAVTIIGSISVASSGEKEVHEMLVAAIGCNLAWGISDAAMYLIRTVTQRGRRRLLMRQLQVAEPAAGRAMIVDDLAPMVAAALAPETIESVRQRLVAAPLPPRQFEDLARDLKGAFGVFVLVVLATFPVVIPFLVFDHVGIALKVSRLIAVVMLMLGGGALSRYAGERAWYGAAAMAVLGIALVAVITALGG